MIRATFDCVTVVPADPMRLNRPWPVYRRSRGTGNREPTDAASADAPLKLEIEDAGPTPHAGWHRGRWLPSVQRALITISPSDPEEENGVWHSFPVDIEFVRSLRPGDLLYVALTPCAGLGLSVIRGETLVAAAGAVTAVPLAGDLVVRYPADLVQAMAALFAEIDPDYQAPELPVEITAEGQRHLIYRGTRTLGPYRIYMIHGFHPGLPGTDECLAISRSGFAETAASSTAQLLGGGEVERGA